jgi:3-dehydroquinate synthase
MSRCFYKISDNISQDLFSYLNEEKYSKVIILVDKNTANYCIPLLKPTAIVDAIIIDIEAGEKYRTLDTASYIWKTLINNKIDRNALLINLGGGTVTDIGGFVATTYKRGINFINIPTTLMSQIDASIGGKNGVNFEGVKNIIGTIMEPDAIFIYPDFILTQEFRDVKSGFGEMIKHALLVGGELWEKTSDITEFNLVKVKKLIPENIAVKCDFVSKDFYDKNIRHALNLGHSIGHAFESAALERGEKLLHGEAVMYGTVAEAIIALRKHLLSRKTFDKIVSFIFKHYPPINITTPEKVLFYLRNDKKNAYGKFKFTMLEDIGRYLIDVNVDAEEITDAILEFNSMV